jgi:aspartyl-tRNA(Asn)/glutamyl-tRNA(Gln) amidotransferase subunit A
MAPAIRERLVWGAGIADDEIAVLRRRHADFKARVRELLSTHELLLMPATPLERLEFGADHTRARVRILRYTTPFSLAGVPVVTIPTKPGGMQLAATHGCDELLVEIAARIGAQRRSAESRA